jgi:hypothetical protein
MILGFCSRAPEYAMLRAKSMTDYCAIRLAVSRETLELV